MREGQFTACATSMCFSPPRNHWTKLLPWKPKGRHQAKLSCDMPEAIKTLYYDTHSPVDSLCNQKISTSVPANLPGAVNYITKQRIL